MNLGLHSQMKPSSLSKHSPLLLQGLGWQWAFTANNNVVAIMPKYKEHVGKKTGSKKLSFSYIGD